MRVFGRETRVCLGRHWRVYETLVVDTQQQTSAMLRLKPGMKGQCEDREWGCRQLSLQLLGV